MDKKISINKIIADIKATKGNRSGCQGLHSSLESDGYITSICKWTRATNPERIDALVEHVEKQDAALIAWEKTMMEVCGEDGPASVANEIRSLRALRDTAMQVLKAQVEQLAAENVGLRGVVSEINNELYGHGFQVAGWHLNGALEPLDNWFTDNGWGEPEIPDTDSVIAQIRNRTFEPCDLPTDEDFWSAIYDLAYQTEKPPVGNVQMGQSNAKSLYAWLSSVLPLREGAK